MWEEGNDGEGDIEETDVSEKASLQSCLAHEFPASFVKKTSSPVSQNAFSARSRTQDCPCSDVSDPSCGHLRR